MLLPSFSSPARTLLKRPFIKLHPLPRSPAAFLLELRSKQETLLVVGYCTLNWVTQHFLLGLSSFNP